MKNPVAALFALSVLAAPPTAYAATKTVDFGRAGLKPGFGSGVDGNDDSIRLEDGGPGAARISFILPKDFKKNSTATLAAYFVADATGCSYNIGAGVVYRDRPGLAELNAIVPSQSGFGTAAGPTPAPSAAFKSFTKNFQLKKPNSGVWTSQQAGDVVMVSITRDGLADTCPNVLWMIGARLTYQTN